MCLIDRRRYVLPFITMAEHTDLGHHQIPRACNSPVKRSRVLQSSPNGRIEPVNARTPKSDVAMYQVVTIAFLTARPVSCPNEARLRHGLRLLKGRIASVEGRTV